MGIKHLLAAGAISLLFSFTARAAEFSDEIERDYALRTIGQLQVTNMRGEIVVRGWAQDKIRVKAVRRATAADREQAQKLLTGVDFRFTSGDGNIELSAEYGRGLSIQERLHEREHPQTSMQMTVFAPARLKLLVWAVDGKVSVRGWNAPLEVRTTSGAIHVDGVKAESVSLLCSACSMEARNIHGALRCMGGAGPIEIAGVSETHSYVETMSGKIKASHIDGEQLYVSKTGPIEAQRLRGHIEFHSQQGPVEILDSSGFLSGRSESGNIVARMRAWSFSDKALIESVSGNIQLTLPASFSSDVDIWSMAGKAELEFPLDRISDQTVGPEPAGRLIGRIGEGGEPLKILSEKGEIHVFRGN
ncbi:MAG: DUF4097 family beta strand repeat-containing protein [Bdellovibrionota bacterium]